MKLRNRMDELPRGLGKPYGIRLPSEIDTIIIHHSGILTAEDQTMFLASKHVNEFKWPGIGYHYLIHFDGTVDKCQPVTTICFHTEGFDGRSIGICLTGDFTHSEPSMEQQNVLAELVRSIKEVMPQITNIIGFWEANSREACPGVIFDIQRFRNSLEGSG